METYIQAPHEKLLEDFEKSKSNIQNSRETFLRTTMEPTINLYSYLEDMNKKIEVDILNELRDQHIVIKKINTGDMFRSTTHSVGEINIIDAKKESFDILNTCLPFFTHLEKLDCAKAEWTTLPHLPHSTREINCRQSSLTTLAPLPPKLEEIIFGECHYITSIPSFPSSLSYISCTDCSLTEFPPFPASLTRIDSWNCKKLKTIPRLPDGLLEINIGNCPSLSQETKDMLRAYKKAHPQCHVIGL